MLTAALFLGSAAAIYFACEFFVNGVEWLGRKSGVGETATGTILAAFGTALPESAVTFVAVVFGRASAQKDIGVKSGRSQARHCAPVCRRRRIGAAGVSDWRCYRP
jgi:hypothetical protein